MKKIILFIVLLSSSYLGKTQQYIYFPDSSATWSISSISWGTCYRNDSYSIVGDTLINNFTYKKINACGDSVFNLGESEYFCAIRDSAKKWMFVFKGQTQALLLYDFSAQTGDTITVNNISGDTLKVTIVNIDSITVNGRIREKINISQYGNVDNYVWESWIGGIGSTHGLFYPSVFVTDGGYELNCFYQNDTLLYSQSGTCGCVIDKTDVSDIEHNKLMVYPNPFENYTTFEFGPSFNFQSIKIFNSQGSLIKSIQNSNTIDLSNFPDGLYLLYWLEDNKTRIFKLVKGK
jgi:hypothetical protein